MADFFNKEIFETNLYKRRPDMTNGSLSHHKLKQVSSEPPPPPPLPQSLNSSLIISISKNLDQAQEYEASSSWETLSIYRVPKFLRNVDKIAYTPQIVSLGPYHRDLKHLQDMDRHKWRTVHHALKRKGHDIRLYLDAIRSIEDRVRACYEAPLSISADTFLESLVLDSIFAIELFRGVAGEGFSLLGYAPTDPVFGVCGSIFPFKLDMIKLENQLPLFVLDRIYALQLGHEPSNSGHVTSLVLKFFHTLSPSYDPFLSAASLNTFFNASSNEALHCLDVFRHSLLMAPKLTSRRWNFSGERQLQFIYCVAELRDAGIKFRRRKSNMFWDIKYKDGVLHIPRVIIQDGTKSLFLNLIAFEQCHIKCSKHITSYVVFMDQLINSEEDVRHLHSKGIIDNWLGNNGEVSDLFDRLGQEVVMDVNDYYLLDLSEQVNRYYNNKCNVWRASLNHKYFSNPWTIISLVAAAVLLLLTFGQTFYTIYAYYKPIK